MNLMFWSVQVLMVWSFHVLVGVTRMSCLVALLIVTGWYVHILLMTVFLSGTISKNIKSQSFWG